MANPNPAAKRLPVVWTAAPVLLAAGAEPEDVVKLALVVTVAETEPFLQVFESTEGLDPETYLTAAH